MLNVRFETSALETYKDFIDGVRGVARGPPEAAKQISGSARWDGTIAGGAGGPAFQGHIRGERVSYDGVVVDYLDGDLTYSPSELALARGHAWRNEMEADIEATLTLTKWSFLPRNEWTAEANFEKVPVEGIEQVLGLSYPVKGTLTGQFHGRGTTEQHSPPRSSARAARTYYGPSLHPLPHP